MWHTLGFILLLLLQSGEPAANNNIRRRNQVGIEDSDACAACQAWYNREIKNTTWIDRLPTCPCSVVRGVLPYTRKPAGSDFCGRLDGVDWSLDRSCNPNPITGWYFCNRFHPGATTCIRADGPDGTGQQCCYDNKNQVILHGNVAAGTPDKSTECDPHQEMDVVPYEDCCIKCPSMCHKYIGFPNGTQGARSDPRTNSELCPGSL